MTQARPHVLLSALYEAAAADLADRTHHGRFLAGPGAWIALHTAVNDLVTHPLTEHARRHLGLTELQHWDTDQHTAVATIRSLANTTPDLGQLQEQSADHRIAAAAKTLREAFGLSGTDHSTLGQLADYAAQEIKILRLENQRLKRGTSTPGNPSTRKPPPPATNEQPLLWNEEPA